MTEYQDNTARGRKRGVLHVVNIFFVVPYFLGEQLRHFRRKGWTEHVVCSPSEELGPYAREMGIGVAEAEVTRSISPLKDLKAIRKTMAYIRRYDIGIVTGHTPKGGLVGMAAAWLARVPRRIYFRHGLVYETSTGLKRALLVNIDRLVSALATDVVCVSPSVMRRSVEDSLCPARKMRVLGNGTCNGIDARQFSRANVDPVRLSALKRELGLDGSDDVSAVIGYAGRLVRDKGIIELVEAFKSLKTAHPGLKLLLVGMLETRDALPQATVDAITGDLDIITTGYVDNRIIQHYYSLMDLFVLPSRREGFPTTVLEAGAMELPVVTTRVTGCIDSTIDGQTGLFADLTPADLAAKIGRLLDDPALRTRLGRAGRERVLADFSQQRVWDEIEKLYL